MRLRRYCIAALLYDWALYAVMMVIQLRASDLGATPAVLGGLQAVYACVYIVMSVVMGHAADRVSRPLMARVGCLLLVACCIAIPRANSTAGFFAIMPLLALAGTCFWPSLQGALGSEAPRARLDRDLGLFNIFWSTGKAAGFLTGAVMKGTLGTHAALIAAGAGGVAIVLFYPRSDTARETPRPAEALEPRPRSSFLRMSWVMNFVGYGIGATLASQYNLLCKDRGIGLPGSPAPVEFFFGTFMFACFAGQALTFVVLRAWAGWTYRRAPLYVAQVAMAAACVGIAHLSSATALLALTPLVGMGLGVAYAASLYYSLHSTEEPGRFAGLHEAILGSGNFILPLAAGALAGGLGDLRWPYWLCGGVALVAIAIEEILYRSSGTSSEK